MGNAGFIPSTVFINLLTEYAQCVVEVLLSPFEVDARLVHLSSPADAVQDRKAVAGILNPKTLNPKP